MAFGLSAGAATLLGAVAAPVVGGLIGGKSGGSAQGGTQTASRDPWAAAQPWLQSNLQTGQNLQNYYAKNPFNAQQQAAYGNLASGNDYVNRLIPGLLQQMSQPAAFDRNNPSAMPNPFNFAAPSVSPAMAHQYGGMMQQSMPVQGNMNLAGNPFAGSIPKPQGAFDASAYLAANPDVANNGYWNQRPLEHYNLHGKSEGRTYTEMGA